MPLAVQYVGATAMAGSLAKKSLLQLADLRTLPKLSVLAEFLKPGIPLGFCIASAMTLVVSATNLAAGLMPCFVLSCTGVNNQLSLIILANALKLL